MDESRQSVTEKQSGHNRDSKGRFGPGNKGGGRPKGVPNKLTQNMKNLIQDELVHLGLSEMADNLFSGIPFPGHRAPFLRPIS